MNILEYILRQLRGSKRGQQEYEKLSPVLDPIVAQLLESRGFPVTVEGAQSIMAAYMARTLTLSPDELGAVGAIVGRAKKAQGKKS